MKYYNQHAFILVFLFTLFNGSLYAQYDRCIAEDVIVFDNPPPTLCDEYGGHAADIIIDGGGNVVFLDEDSFGGQWQDQTIEINSTVVVNQDFSITNCRLSFAPGTRFVILDGANILIDRSKLFACNQMWKGIRINNGTLRFYRNQIEDAQYAIDGGHGGTINLSRNQFYRNHIGVRAVLPVSNNFSIGTFTQNSFSTTEELNSPYENQNPHPGLSSYAGVLLRNVDGATLYNSTFEDLINGIIIDQSTVAVRGCEFRTMRNIDYNEYINDYPNACGIIAIDSDLQQSGNEEEDFISCRNAGIYTENSDIISSRNDFLLQPNEYGYDINGVRFGNIDIQNNRFSIFTWSSLAG